MLVQPQRVIIALMRRQMAVAAARTNHQRRARRPARRDGVGQIGRERGDVVARAAQRAGCAVRPEGNGDLRFGA